MKKVKVVPTIYVQIAAYRDPELVKTIEDCLRNAKDAKRLRFGIAWQHSTEDTWDTLDKYKADPRFTILDIDAKDAKGVCYARHLLNNHYKGETYTLQLDSHHRFIKNWDTELIKMLEDLRKKGHKKPLLTAYAPDFFPDKYSEGTRNKAPWIMSFDRFFPEGVVFAIPEGMDDYKTRTEPYPSRFFSAHFVFADGKLCEEVPYDPEYYFHGEEPDMAIRSFMMGYDLFHPHKNLIWHEYLRNGKVKHWDDDSKWVAAASRGYAHFRERYGMVENTQPLETRFMLKNPPRTLREYERYAGIEFSTRRVHKNATTRKVPSTSVTEEEFVAGLQRLQKICVDVHKSQLTETDYDVLVVVLLDSKGNEVHREDVDRKQYEALVRTHQKDEGYQIWRTTYTTDALVAGWMVWPHSVSKGWMQQIKGSFTVE